MIKHKKKVWKYNAKTGSWYFISYTRQEILDGLDIKKPPSGWGQIPVEVSIGDTKWNTSLFPSKERGYDLPIKETVRKKEKIYLGSVIEIMLSRS